MRASRGLLGFFIGLGSLFHVGEAAAADRTLVVTLDDLPYVHVTQDGYLSRADKATRDLLAALKAREVPAVGFVNEVQLQVRGEIDERTALLQQWVDAGMALGNHTYSHRNLTDSSIEAFEDEIVRGDIVTRRLMQPRQPYQLYFRHPMTRTGDTQEKKLAIETFLAARGYQVAPHTIENMDFAFNVVHAAAKARGDAALAQRVREEYLRFTFAATDFAEGIAPRIFGRDIPQTLLLHANDLNAEVLGEMLARYAARGYRFVSLDAAMADGAYRTPDTVVNSRGPTWLWRWSRSLGQDLSFRDEPEAPGWIMQAHREALAR